MKDERQSAAVNEAWDADALRMALGQRMRMARTALGLSQQAVADAMRQRGFNWRQTTVAKTEAADRPTLFTEVVALSSVLKRDLPYFLSGRTALDDVKEALQAESKQAEESVEHMHAALERARRHHEKAVTREGIALAVTEYSYALDSGPLKRSVEIFLESDAFSIPACKDILDAAGVPLHVIEAMDADALRVAAEAMHANVHEREFWLPGFEHSEIIQALHGYLQGAQVPSYFLAFIRGADEYRKEAGRLLIDAVIEYVEPRADW